MSEHSWAAQPKQHAFLIRDEDEVFFGGAAGGGKSDALLLFNIMRRTKYPGSRGLLLRRTYAELEREGSLIPRSHELLTGVAAWNGTNRKWTFKDGGVIEFGYCAQERDVYQYQSSQYDDIGFDELTHFTEFQYLYMMSRCRTTKPKIKPLIRSASNPGNIGHGWVKKRFIDTVAPLSTYTDEHGRTRCFVPSKLTDNLILMQADPGYMQRMKLLPERERMALLEGRWDLFAGQYFNEFAYDVHVVSRMTKIEPHWYRFGAYDHGFNHPFCFGWYAADEDGNVFKYRELMNRHLRPDQIAAAVHAYPDTKDLKYIMAGHDCWSRMKDGGVTIAEQFGGLGNARLNLIRANIDRKQGASQMRAYMAHRNLPEGSKGPRFFVFEDCVRTIETIQRMIHNDKDVEDVLKVNATESDMYVGDDAYDETRYALMSRPSLAVKPKKLVPYGTYGWMQEEHAKLKRDKKKNSTMIRRTS